MGDARPPRDETVGVSIPAGHQPELSPLQFCGEVMTAPPPNAIPRLTMSELAVTILAETPKDAVDRRCTSAPSGPPPVLSAACASMSIISRSVVHGWIGTLLVGSVRQLPICMTRRP
jgi:hypothetical protein